MKNHDLKRYPSVEELYALERAAREARAAEMARLLGRAFEAVRRLFESKGQTKGLRHA
jgi:hypothetical protein